MKAFLELGVLSLLVCLIRSEDEPVTVECTLLMFRVFVKKHLFGDGVLVRAEELTLGLGCPVNREMPDKFELYYSVTECGIEFQAFEAYVIYKTYLHYTSMYHVFGHGSRHFPLSCQVPKILHSKQSTKSDAPSRLLEDKRKGALRMFPSVFSSTFWTPELCQRLESKEHGHSSKQETESWNWVSLPILTLSSVACHVLCHGDVGLSAS